MHYAVIETRQNGRATKEESPRFDNKLSAECWLRSACREAKSLKIKIVDHYLCREEQTQ